DSFRAHEFIQRLFEAGIRFADAFNVLNNRFAIREHAGDRKRHRDPVIAEARDSRALQLTAAMDFEAILLLDDFHSHRPQIMRDRSDAVGFLDAQLLGLANNCRATRQRPGDSEDRQLVDELWDFLALNYGAFERRARYLHGS